MIINRANTSTLRCCGPEGCGEIRHSTRWCIGSQCMAWRKTTDQHGYCGYAGIPLTEPLRIIKDEV